MSRRGTTEVAEGDGSRLLARNSLSVAQWTLVSRFTGFLRIVVIAAVLGPTYLGNTFQAANLLPNVTFELMSGQLFATLLIPALVRHIDARDRRATEEVAGSFLGIALLGFAGVAVVGILASPLILAILSSTVADPATAAAQRDAGILLLVMLMPQVVLYAVAGIGAAVMNAHGRFALAAAAPAIENVGVIATVTVVAIIFGTGQAIDSVSTGQLLILGLGSTAAVGLHAGLQWWGALRAGVRLKPRAGWRDPEMVALLRRTVPSLGYSSLNGVRMFGPMVVANSLPGGVVAFNLAQNFFYLPIALGARPVSVTLLPQLSRLSQEGALLAFRNELVRGAGLIAFVTIPCVAAYLALSEPLADAAAFGEIATPAGRELIVLSLAGLAAGVLGEAGFFIGTHGAYAMGDAVTPFRSMIVRTTVAIAGMVMAATLFDGPAVLLVLGFAISAGDLVGAWHLGHRLKSRLPGGEQSLTGPVIRALAGSALMIVPAYAIAVLLDGAGNLSDVVAMVAAGTAGIGTFVLVQLAWRSPELTFLASGLRRPRGPD